MNLLKEKFRENLFEGCMLALVGKTMLFGAGFPEALIVISLVVSICYAKHYLGKKKADFTAEQVEKLDAVDKTVKSLLAANSIKRGFLGETKK